MIELNEYYEEENLKNLTFYHGTTTLFNISSLKPPIETNILREDFRKNNQDVVYITSSYGSALRYAQKAADKFGGEPIVYRVEPDYDSLIHRIDFEYTTNFARIKEREND